MVGETAGVIRILRTHYPICTSRCVGGELVSPRTRQGTVLPTAAGPSAPDAQWRSLAALTHLAERGMPVRPHLRRWSLLPVRGGRDLPRACTHKTSHTAGMSQSCCSAFAVRMAARSSPRGPLARAQRHCARARRHPMRWLGEEVGRTRTRRAGASRSRGARLATRCAKQAEART